MNRIVFGIVAFLGGVALISAPAISQPPMGKDGKDAKGKDGKDGKGGPPRYELGQVFPPPLLEELNLTATQQKELEKIQADLKTKLGKLLTDDQKKTCENFRPRGPGGPGGPGGEKGGKGGDPGKGGERPPFEKNEKPPVE